MSEVLEFNKRARVRDEASLWLTRLQEGLSVTQETELAVWLSADDDHELALLDLATIWDELEVLTELAPLFEGMPISQSVQSHVNKSKRLRSPWVPFGIAASVFVAFVFSAITINVPPNFNNDFITTSSTRDGAIQDRSLEPTELLKQVSTHNIFKTAIGEQLELTLADGSIASLNTDTQIDVRFSADQRTIHLLRGEAHFDVFKDPRRPLNVLVSGKSVQAVGTAFSVRKKSNTDIEVAVDEGLVAVYQVKTMAGEDTESSLKASLDAGDVLTIDNERPHLAEFELNEMEDRLAWRKGMIVINDQTLNYVINEFGRYSEQKVLLADRNMGEIRVAGYFRLGDIDALLLALESNFKIHSEYYQSTNTFVLSQL